ncbi:MAG TPA: ferredoxin [Flexivirga sp.]|uniref:ferredoxin n=1 Tax=Flexivirga sp. TaxID=1962927 RepID=UPI002CACB11D|nr:ferredoxin [Flexivirga sp.]HWC23757.1 ferredoxin [Flexivirga sp.]
MRAETDRSTVIRVDRIACSGHGVCHALDPQQIPLDEWGYPIPSEIVADRRRTEALVRLCPAAALRRTTTT